MDTSSISSNKITLKLSTPQGREMALNKGEVLQAQVQEVGEDGSVTILVKGRPIEAFSEVPVKPGQQLLLMVDELKQGKTYLKVVTPELMGKIETANISANLAGMGIAAREDTIMLARKLLQHNLPVTQNNLNELSRNVSTLGGMNAKNLEIGAFALSRGISGKESLTSLAQFLSSTGETARLVPALERLANALTAANTDSEMSLQAAAAKNTASGSSTAASTSSPVVNTNPASNNQAAPSGINSAQTQAVREQSAGSAAPSVSNRTAAQPGPALSFNAAVEAEITAPGVSAAAANAAPTAGAELRTANQTAAFQNSSLSTAPETPAPNQAAGTTAAGSREARETIVTESKPEGAADKSTRPGAAAAQTIVDGDESAAGSPKQAAGQKAGEAPAAGTRSAAAAGMQDRMVQTGVGESLNRSVGSEAGASAARPSVSAGEKPAAVNEGEPVIPSKTDSGGMTAKGNTPLPTAGAGEKPVQAAAAGAQNVQAAGILDETVPQASSGEKTVPPQSPAASSQAAVPQSGAPTARSENTAQIPQNAAPAAGTSAQEPAGSIMQTISGQLSAEEPVPAVPFLSADGETTTGLPSGADRVDLKTAAQGTAADSEPLKQTIAKLLDAMRSLMELDLQDAPEQIAGKLQSSENIDKEIVKALSLLADMAKNPEMANKIPELKDFSLGLERLEREMTGQQLFNLSSRSAADNLSGYYYFAFPVKIDQEYSLCQLKINKEGRRNLKDADKLSFVVSLNTSKLGLVLFHINWQRTGSLQLQGVSENQASSNYLNRNMGELVSKLENLGYSVKNLGVKVSSSAEELRVRPVLQEVTERVRPLGIDVTI